MHFINLPERVTIHEDLIAAIRSRDWTAIRDNLDFFGRITAAHLPTTVLHWMIQEPAVPVADVVHFMDTIYDRPVNELAPTDTTLLQRAIAANRIDVMLELIARGAQLFHDMNCALIANPLLLALHPRVTHETFAALVERYALPPGNAFAHYVDPQHKELLAFYVPIARERMVQLKAAGLDVAASHLDLLAAEPVAFDYSGADLAMPSARIRYLTHYLAVRNMAVSVHIAREFPLPFADPALAKAVLYANDAELTATLVRTLKLGERTVADGKSAMLLAAEHNADESCRALMAAGVDGAFEDTAGSFLSLSRPVTAYLAALERNAGLATELLTYNSSRSRTQTGKK